MPYSRLICVLPGEDTVSDLTLDGVHVSVEIVDVHAQVVMSQRFTNPFNSKVEATYSFAVLANAAVCGFEMVRGDGTKVVGKAMEKQAAKKAYEKAVSEGKTAGLGEEQTKDVFSIKVGNITAQETVTINLTTLIPLTDDEKPDQVRFTFPRGYAFRYGASPTAEAAKAVSTPGAAQKLSVDVTIQQASPIKSISCPSSHPIELSLGPPEGTAVDSSIPESHFASVKLSTSSPYLEQDFILVVTATGLDSPRCFVESHPSPNENTTALGLTFVPRFKLPDVKDGMEYIFVVDRSGSMRGTSIQLVREALVVLLRGLPTNSTTFNIFSFGTSVDGLWPSSKDYTQDSMDEATKHVDGMNANYGGTEIANTLKHVFGTLPKERKRPVSVFLLTDGGAWDVENCENITRGALASPGAFIRVFTVGIGTGASTNTVDSIARAGEGMPIYIQANEPMTGKLARLVRAARTPAIKDIEVLWPKGEASAEDDFEMVESEESKPPTATSEAQSSGKPINLFSDDDDNDKDGKDVGPPPKPVVKPESITPPPVQQAPLTIHNLFPGTRTQIYAIISSLQGPLPSSIKVRGKVATTGDIVELDIGVAKIMSTRTALIHTLAARSIITDREDGKHTFPSSVAAKSDVLSAHIEADIIRLGTKYGLTSRHTSYVAIDERDNKPEQNTGPVLVVHHSMARSGIRARMMPSARMWSAPGGSAAMFSAPTSARSALPPPMARGARGAQLISDPESEEDSEDEDDDEEEEKLCARSQRFNQPHLSRFLKGNTRGADTESEEEDADEQTADAGGITAIARLQQFNGGFVSSPRVFKLVQVSPDQVKQAFSGVEVSEDVIATLLALEWMRKNAQEEAEDMIEKAEDWLQNNVNDTSLLDELKKKASQLL